jgi:protein TonB
MNEGKTSYTQIDDLVFDGKNKAYGAYQLRKAKEKNAAYAALTGMLIILALYLIPFIIALHFTDRSVDEERTVEVVATPYSELVNPPPLPDEHQEPQAVEEPPEVATKRFLRPEVKPDDEVSEEDLIPTVEELKIANPGFETKEGTGDIHAVYTPKKVVVDTLAKPAPREQIYNFVERFPLFPGGEEAMQLFIAKNIVYPESAMNAGIQGTVIVQFVVDREGRISNPVVVRDIGGGCGKAAIDVILKMPKWVPGEQNGIPVSVRCTLPVRFRLVK